MASVRKSRFCRRNLGLDLEGRTVEVGVRTDVWRERGRGGGERERVRGRGRGRAEGGRDRGEAETQSESKTANPLKTVNQAPIRPKAHLLHHILERNQLLDIQIRRVGEVVGGRVEVDVEAGAPAVLQMLDQGGAEGRLAPPPPPLALRARGFVGRGRAKRTLPAPAGPSTIVPNLLIVCRCCRVVVGAEEGCSRTQYSLWRRVTSSGLACPIGLAAALPPRRPSVFPSRLTNSPRACLSSDQERPHILYLYSRDRHS
jgi:hypothetical protein